MSTISAYEAKTHFSQLLARVAKGERITITRHGVPVATLQPADLARARPARETIDQLLQFRRGKSLRGLKLKKMIEEGRK